MDEDLSPGELDESESVQETPDAIYEVWAVIDPND
jgi:hypothetical protein